MENVVLFYDAIHSGNNFEIEFFFIRLFLKNTLECWCVSNRSSRYLAAGDFQSIETMPCVKTTWFFFHFSSLFVWANGKSCQSICHSGVYIFTLFRKKKEFKHRSSRQTHVCHGLQAKQKQQEKKNSSSNNPK